MHQLLLELIAGGAKKDLSAAQAKALLATVHPRDAVGKTRRRVAAELIADLERVYQRSKQADKELKELVAGTVQLRNATLGRAYFDRRKAAGKTSMEAMRSLKRRLSDIVYRQMINDAIAATATGPGGHRDTSPSPA